MEKTTADIQALINQKADKKLEAEVEKLSRSLYNGEAEKLLDGISVNIGTQEKPKAVKLSWILGDSGFRKQIIENNTERYRADETAAFLNKVESLKEDVDELMGMKTEW